MADCTDNLRSWKTLIQLGIVDVTVETTRLLGAY